jgi:hypothetical protein
MDEKGVALGLVLVGANRHDVSQLQAVLDRKIVQPPKSQAVPEKLCAEAGEVGEKAEAILRAHGDLPQVPPRGADLQAKKHQRFKPRRGIVEVAHSWFNNFRKLKVHYEKSASNCLAFHHLAASFIALRRCHAVNGRNVIYG